MTDLTLQTHGEKGWRPATGFGFAGNQALQPLATDEIGRVSDGIPVAFRQQGDIWQAVAVMAPTREHNLFVAEDGRWRAPFVPAALRVYPFCPGDGPETVALWSDYTPEPLGRRDVRPFFVDEALSPELQRIKAFLTAVDSGINHADAPLRLLYDAEALEPWTPEVSEAPQIEESLPGLYRVNETALQRLADDVWLSLRNARALRWLYAHLDSLYHVRRFNAFARQHGRMRPRSQDRSAELDAFLGAMGDSIDSLDP